MTLCNIVFESETEASQENIPPQTNFNQIESEPGGKSPKLNVRFLTMDDEVACSPKKSLKNLSSDLFTLRIVRSEKTHVYGTRYFFHCFSTNASLTRNSSNLSNSSEILPESAVKHLYMSKAKSPTSKIIPIGASDTIHLRDSRPLAYLQVENDNSTFTLIKNTKGNRETNNIQDSSSSQNLMVVKIAPPRTPEDGDRRITVLFLGLVEIPSRLVSLPLTTISAFEGRYMQYSIKNAILADEKTRTPIITIRKTDVNDIEIDTHYNIDPLYLFGLGICIFFGKKPTK